MTSDPLEQQSSETAIMSGSTAETAYVDPEECMAIAGTKLQELLKETCELPLEKVAALAEEHGIKPLELLMQADRSDTCYIDYISGHVRCRLDVSDNDDPAD